MVIGGTGMYPGRSRIRPTTTGLVVAEPGSLVVNAIRQVLRQEGTVRNSSPILPSLRVLIVPASRQHACTYTMMTRTVKDHSTYNGI
jgi:hypothetical protein